MIKRLMTRHNLAAKSTAWRLPINRRIFFPATLLVGMMLVVVPILAQEENQWAPQRTIIGYHPETDPPILIADQNGTVHAFSSQWLGELDGQYERSRERSIIYNQWTVETGWTAPIDILLSPIKNDARLLDVFLDESGMFHLAFFGGDDNESNIYYSKAPAYRANLASAWSKPAVVGQKALVPENGGIAGDDKGNLIIIYSGNSFGRGWYTTISSDNGTTWSEPELVFPVYARDGTPYYLRTIVSDAGRLHAVWSVNDIQNHGLAIYYTNYDFETEEWGDPVVLAEQSSPGNLGTQAPIIIEYHDALFVMYYDGSTNKQYFTQSTDGGQTWSEPVAPFPHIGMNGPAGFVADSDNVLHLFWGQRLSGSPDMHGVWHSTWQETKWSEFESVVKGPIVQDNVGFNAFDPIKVKLAISGGNEVLAVWRSDYHSRGNGIWYSTAVFDAPQLPASPLPTIPSPPGFDNNVNTITESPGLTPEAKPRFNDQLDIQEQLVRDPSESIFSSAVPVVLVILLIVLFRQLSRSRQR